VGTERSGVHDEEWWTKDRALEDTAGGCAPGRQVMLFTVPLLLVLKCFYDVGWVAGRPPGL